MHLSEYMAKNNLDDAAVAAGVDVDRSTINRIRRGKMRPDWPTITRLRRFTKGQCTANDFEVLKESA